jgi:hypothetical protein
MKKRTIGLFLAVAMILSLGTTVFAIDSEFTEDSLSKQSAIDNRIEDVIEERIASGNIAISVGELKTLYDFAGNEYRLIECEPTGYYILHLESGIIVESATNSMSPYSEHTADLYYAGPTYYYAEMDEEYVHTVVDESLTAIQVADAAILCEGFDSELISQSDDRVANFIDGTSITLDVNGPSNRATVADTDYWVTSYTWLKNRTTGFGYVSGGYCGYIAANLLLKYWNYRGDITLPPSYATTNSTALTDELIDIGEGLGYSAGTVAWEIKAVINEFGSDNSVPEDSHWALGVLNITNEVNNNHRPCILFGNLGNDGNHAVVVYGYNTYENSGYYTFVCHYGWNNYSEVHVYGGTSIFGSNTQYRV